MKFSVGSSVMQGRREAQEDRHFVIENLLEFMIKHHIQIPEHDESVFQDGLLLGIFDGHMGSNAASFCCKELPIEIVQGLCSPDILEEEATKTEDSVENTSKDDVNCTKKRRLEETSVAANSILSNNNFNDSENETSSSNQEIIINPDDSLAVRTSKSILQFETSAKSFKLYKIARTLFQAFANIDNRFLSKFRLNKDGSTALVVLIFQLHLFVAWVGDSRAVLGSYTKVVFDAKVPIGMENSNFKDTSALFFESDPYSMKIGYHERRWQYVGNEPDWLSSPLTADHKPHRADERRRIISSGGILLYTAGVARVAKKSFEEQCRQIRNSGLSFGSSSSIQQPIALAVSRAIGDKDMKASTDLKTSLISPIPEIRYLKLDPQEDKVIILACDGVWDVITEREAIELTKSTSRAYFKFEEPTTESLSSAIASKLVTLAFKKGSQDNLTAVVVVLES